MNKPAPQDDDDEGPIFDEVRMTAYDRRRLELRELEAKRDLILSKPEQTEDDAKRLAVLAPLIQKAQERFDREGDRAKNDVWRQRRAVDDWRRDEGREEYNAKRRKVRHHPNADLSNLTPEEKAQVERDRRADANWFKRQRGKGVSEAAITAAYAVRLEQRRASREADASTDALLREHEHFGMF